MMPAFPSPRADRFFKESRELPVTDIREHRERHIRTRLLKDFDPKDPQKMFMEILERITQAVELADEKTETALRGIEAVLFDENLRLRLFEIWQSGKEGAMDEKYVNLILNCYRKFLQYRDAWPKELAAHLLPEDLIGFYVDLLANKKFFVGKDHVSPQELVEARVQLRRITEARRGFSAETLGKSAEWALIGLLRYGRSVYEGTNNNEPALFVAHALPREDLYGVGMKKKSDIVLRVPGHSTVDKYGIRSRIGAYSGELNVIAEEVCWCWDQIADPNRMMSPMQLNEWRNRYRAVIEDVTREMVASAGGRVNKAMELQEFLLPRAKRRRVEMVSEADLDAAFTLEKMKIHWPEVLKSFPGFETIIGKEVTIENFRNVKLAYQRLYEKRPELTLWKGWIKTKRRKAS